MHRSFAPIRGYLCMFVSACGPIPAAEEGGAAGTTSTATTSTATSNATSTATSTTGGPAPTTSGAGSTTSTGAGAEGTGTTHEVPSTEESGSPFIDPRLDAPMNECDVWQQDCPVGEKCAAYANDGGNSWNALKCVPVMEDPAQPGEPCFVVDSGVSGIDNCDLGAMCWDTDAENQGRCVALCTGTPDDPVCAPGLVCLIANDGVLILCIDGCDPLTQDCDPSDLCVPNPNAEGFLCVLDPSGRAGLHDSCISVNTCDPGMWCAPANSAVECDQEGVGCCEPFCDLTLPNTCPGQGQLCQPWYPEGQAPPGDEDIGFCAVPG